MKTAQWDEARDKMIIDTPLKVFNEQTNIITTGNIVAPTMIGRRVRAFNDLSTYAEHNYTPGYLQEFDSDVFVELLQDRYYQASARNLRKLLHIHGADRSLYVYMFFHFGGTHVRKRVIHGIIATDATTHLEVFRIHLGPSYKSMDVLDVCAKYVTNGKAPR